MRWFSWMFLLSLMVGCPGSTKETPENFSACDGDEGQDYAITNQDTGGVPAFIDGDTLWVEVAYGGGCEEHEFAICWPDLAFMESDPVQVDLEIWHGGTPDMCEAYIYETLSFDLTPLKTAWHDAYGAGAGTIIINLAGAPEPLTYSFE